MIHEPFCVSRTPIPVLGGFFFFVEEVVLSDTREGKGVEGMGGEGCRGDLQDGATYVKERSGRREAMVYVSRVSHFENSPVSFLIGYRVVKR